MESRISTATPVPIQLKAQMAISIAYVMRFHVAVTKTVSLPGMPLVKYMTTVPFIWFEVWQVPP
jgi:hypothetical protein